MHSVPGPFWGTLRRGTGVGEPTRGARGARQHLQRMQTAAAGPKAPADKVVHSHPNAVPSAEHRPPPSSLRGGPAWPRAAWGKPRSGLCPPTPEPPQARAPSSQRRAALTAASPRSADLPAPPSTGLLPSPGEPGAFLTPGSPPPPAGSPPRRAAPGPASRCRCHTPRASPALRPGRGGAPRGPVPRPRLPPLGQGGSAAAAGGKRSGCRCGGQLPRLRPEPSRRQVKQGASTPLRGGGTASLSAARRRPPAP